MVDERGFPRWPCVVWVVMVVGAIACSGGAGSKEGRDTQVTPSQKIRQAAFAGSFYPGSEKALRDSVSSMLGAVGPADVKGRILGLICPHAGYMYSGHVAAHGYRLVAGQRFDAVVVVAPSHRMHFDGSSVYAEGAYNTPLGPAEIATDVAASLMRADSSVVFRPDVHAVEHSLEVQIPFLQVAIPDLKVVPVVMGSQSPENCKRLAGAIVSAVGGKKVLLVASTDLSHFHDYDTAVRLDKIVMDHVSKYDPEGLANALAFEKCEACGGGPVVAVMMAAREMGATGAVILKYANSGDVTGDKSSVVGYLSAVLVGEEAGRPKVGVDLGLTHAERVELVKIARRSIEARVGGRQAPEMRTESAILREKRGAFVTITEEGELRGCIGYIRAVEPLYVTVSRMAAAAATEDPRFPPLTPEEVKRVSIEISVLTPLRKITNPEEIQVGRDGLYLEKGPYQGLLLPQVATEYGWDRHQFLDHTCLKAGLEAGSWREGADVYTFSAQVFSEAEVLGKQ